MLKLKSNKRKSNIKQGIAYVILTLLAIMCIFPFYVLITNTTRSHAEINRGFSAVPGSLLVTNIRKLMLNDNLPVLRALFNSVYVAVLTAAAASYFSSLTAYGLFAYRFKMRRAAQSFILLVMMIPTQVSALGFIDQMDKMGFSDTYVPLIVPAIASPTVVFFIYQYMTGYVPKEIIDAARIDGAGEFRAFNKIIIPIIKPAIAVQAIFSFVGSWNNFFTPSLILDSAKKKTLPLLIAQLRGADFMKFDMGQVYTLIAFAIVPAIIFYLIFSKQIIGGTTAGSIKG